jgi:hypothetical protein
MSPNALMVLRGYYKPLIVSSILIEATFSSLGIAKLLPAIVFLGPLAWVLAAARLVLTVLEFTAVTFLLHHRDAGPMLARRVLLASACLVVVEVGLRLAPTNLDPTFKWWVVSAYWVYVVAIRWMLRSLAVKR